MGRWYQTCINRKGTKEPERDNPLPLTRWTCPASMVNYSSQNAEGGGDYAMVNHTCFTRIYSHFSNTFCMICVIHLIEPVILNTIIPSPGKWSDKTSWKWNADKKKILPETSRSFVFPFDSAFSTAYCKHKNTTYR